MANLTPFRPVLPIACLIVGLLSACTTRNAEPVVVQSPKVSTATPNPEPGIGDFVTEAAQRFDLPERWIDAVIEVESSSNPRAVSSAGAMGLMQIMPGTWTTLRIRYGLGDDPFDPRDNILAGTAYLREMHDRFGAPGFLAAYNAGPARYAEHLATGRPLPRETRDYVAALTPMLGDTQTVRLQQDDRSAVMDWRAAPMFALRNDASVEGDVAPSRKGSEGGLAGVFVPLQARTSP